MERIEAEPFWLRRPDFADVFVRCEASKCLQPAAEIVGVDKVVQVPAELIVVVVVEAFYRRVLDGSVHPLDLTICPWVARFGQTVLDVEISASHLERMATKGHVVTAHDLYIFRGPAITGWIGEVGPVVSQYGVDFVGNGLRQRPEEVTGNASGCLLNKLGKGELGSPVDGYEEIEPAFSRMHLGNVDVKIADRIALELLLWLLVASDLRQPRNTVALKASMQ